MHYSHSSLPQYRPNTSFIMISYAEVMDMLKAHAGQGKLVVNKELEKILEVLVFSYFSSINISSAMSLSVGMQDMLSDNQFHNFEQSEAGFEINMLIVNTTKNYLPGFRSTENIDCAKIVNLEMVNRHCLKMEIASDALPEFVRKKPFYQQGY